MGEGRRRALAQGATSGALPAGVAVAPGASRAGESGAATPLPEELQADALDADGRTSLKALARLAAEHLPPESRGRDIIVLLAERLIAGAAGSRDPERSGGTEPPEDPVIEVLPIEAAFALRATGGEVLEALCQYQLHDFLDLDHPDGVLAPLTARTLLRVDLSLLLERREELEDFARERSAAQERARARVEPVATTIATAERALIAMRSGARELPEAIEDEVMGALDAVRALGDELDDQARIQRPGPREVASLKRLGEMRGEALALEEEVAALAARAPKRAGGRRPERRGPW